LCLSFYGRLVDFRLTARCDADPLPQFPPCFPALFPRCCYLKTSHSASFAWTFERHFLIAFLPNLSSSPHTAPIRRATKQKNTPNPPPTRPRPPTVGGPFPLIDRPRPSSDSSTVGTSRPVPQLISFCNTHCFFPTLNTFPTPSNRLW